MEISERWIIGTLLTVAMLTFFFPLATFQIPIVGNQEVSGYDLISRAKELNQTLGAANSEESRPSGSEPSQPLSGSPTAQAPQSSLPLLVRTLLVVPIEILISFAASLIALVSCFSSNGRASVKATATVGGVASVAAILQLTVANSDLHSWFREQIERDSSSFVQNPLDSLAKQFESLAANSFQLKPGAGLYVLAAAVSLAAVLLFSRVFSPSPSVEAPKQPVQSGASVKMFVFLAILATCIVIAVLVLTYAPPRTANPNIVRQPTQPVATEADIFKWPDTGLPKEITNALNTPDLAPEPGAQTELALGINGEKQIIATDADDSMNCGSGGCSWRLIDAATKDVLISDESGSLHKTTSITDGYVNLVVEGKLTLLLYQHREGTYRMTSCYNRSDGLGSPARAVPCEE